MEFIINAIIANCKVKPDEVTHVGNHFFVCRLGEMFGLYDHQSRNLAIDFICSDINHFPNTTHLWVEYEGKVGVFDTNLREMILQVSYTTVCHTQVPGVFEVWIDIPEHDEQIQFRLNTNTQQA